MKDTANYFLVVAMLIACIKFVATFVVPGGYNQNKGIPTIFTIRDIPIFTAKKDQFVYDLF